MTDEHNWSPEVIDLSDRISNLVQEYVGEDEPPEKIAEALVAICVAHATAVVAASGDVQHAIRGAMIASSHLMSNVVMLANMFAEEDGVTIQ